MGNLLGCKRDDSSSEYVPPKVWQAPPDDPNNPFANKPTAGKRFDKELQKGEHNLQLYSLGTPNGMKVTILLEELVEMYKDFEYDAWYIDIMKGDQFSSGFVDVNPNSKIPALLDYKTSPPTRVWESVSILLYIAEHYGGDEFIPQDHYAKIQMMNWLFWQVGSAPYVGGGFGHFYKYYKKKLEYPINRFTMETKRQFDLLDKQLATNKYIIGDTYTLADMAIWPWYGGLVLKGFYNNKEFLDVKSYTNLIRWAEMIEERPAVQRGFRVNNVWLEPKGIRERHTREDLNALMDKESNVDGGGAITE